MRKYEPLLEKTCLCGFRPGQTQTGFYSHRKWLEARNFGYRRKERNFYIYIAKTKVLAMVSLVITAQLICAFVVAYMQMVGLLIVTGLICSCFL